MTFLDRFLQEFPALKNIVFWLDSNSIDVVVVPVVLFLLFIFYWTFVVTRRRAGQVMRTLVGQGYSLVQSDDPRLAGVLKRLTPIMHHSYELSTVTSTTPWSVDTAYENSAGWANRYFAQIRRSVSRSPRDGGYEVRSEFTIAFFESRALPFTQDVYIAGDGYSLDRGYGLHRVDDEALGPLASLYVFHTGERKFDPLPSGLVEALMDCAPLLSVSAKRAHMNDPFLFYARIRFTPEGWGLISNEFVYRQEKMDALVEAVNRISGSLR